jgi:hypothetical protein
VKELIKFLLRYKPLSGLGKRAQFVAQEMRDVGSVVPGWYLETEGG